MRLRWWETVAALPALAVVALFFAARHWVGATVLLAVVVFFGASRAHVVERNVAGFHARTRGTILLIRAVSLLAIYVVLVYGWFVMSHEHWTRDRHGLVAFYASLGFGIFLLRDIRQLGNDADRWLRGGEMEESVATRIDHLRADGWIVVHNVLRDDGGGNVDHFVSSPSGNAFAIETKSGKARVSDRGQATSSAYWARSKFGVRFVNPVLCVGTEPPDEPTSVTHGRATVWIMGVEALDGWLRSFDAHDSRRATPRRP